jgi:sodium/potassium-transporting ATPase subunit alpha
MKSLIARKAVVIRDGKQQIIKAADIVVGGVVIMSYKSAL